MSPIGRRSKSGSPPPEQRRQSRRRSPNGMGHDLKPQASPTSAELDRGRSRTRKPSNPYSEDSLRRRGYHSIYSTFGKVFHVERRWKMIRDLGSGAYGVVISAADDISGETVAIKLVTRVFEKVSFAKRALREITLLRHFANHENITGLIDIDAISQDFNEVYLFMEPMEADLHQIIKSGQVLTNEHVQYFVYQILRGCKYIHTASVVHRDLKPGNLLVNSDCELKICDFGLSRGYDSDPDQTTHMTEYVATRWYRAPEIMLAFRRYDTAIDMWSIGCILGELLLGRPLFKGKDYVDQLNKILDILGSPDETVVNRIGSEKAQAYVRSLPHRKTVPFQKLMHTADPQALDLLRKLLNFDPQQRISVHEALEHPWLATYHDINDEPECPIKFEKWKDIERLETIQDYREAMWKEISEYRKEVRSINFNLSGLPLSVPINLSPSAFRRQNTEAKRHEAPFTEVTVFEEPSETPSHDESFSAADDKTKPGDARQDSLIPPSLSPAPADVMNDPMVTYSLRPSFLHNQQHSTSASPLMRPGGLPPHSKDPSALVQDAGTIPFPGQGGTYIVPVRSRTQSTAGDFVPRKLLRTLSTVSIHESLEGLPGSLAGIGPMGRFMAGKETGADAPASEMPKDFRIQEKSERSDDETENDVSDGAEGKGDPTVKKERRFLLF